MAFEFKPNPNFKADVMKAAQEKLSNKLAPTKIVMLTEKDVLQKLQNGERLGNTHLEHLSQKGLIKVSDVTNMNTPAGQREWLFIDFTDKGRSVLEG